MGQKIVLMYHRVNDTENDYNRITVEKEIFRTHMSYLKDKFRIITLGELLSYEGEEDAAAITFDDGFADFYENALPILTEYEIPVTIFITTGKLNTTEELWTTEILRILFANNSGDESIRLDLCGKQVELPVFTLEQKAETYKVLRHVLMQLSAKEREDMLGSIRKQLQIGVQGREEYRLMSVSEVREIAANPLVTIGAHTVNHISMGRIADTELLYEIQQSIRDLENILKQRIKFFAYPFGTKADYSDRAIEILCKNGIEAACAVEGRIYDDKRDSRYAIPRMCVGNWTLNQLQDKLEEWISEQDIEKDEPCGNIRYMGSPEKDDVLWNSNRKVVIWGTGVRGKRMYELLCKYGQGDRILAFGDNNPDMWTRTIDNIPVWNAEQIREQKNVDILLYNTFDMELIRQFIQIGFESIHWLI